MKNGVIAFVAIMMTTAFFLSPAMAAEEGKRFWVTMNLGQFPPTPESAAEQCGLAASLPDSRVTAEQCTTLKSMLDAGKCVVGSVPDGIRFDLMSTFEKGRPVVVGPMTKKLGRTDQAKVCNVGDDVTAYFFVGEPTSCGNLAFVVETPEVVEAAKVGATPRAAGNQKCRWVTSDRKVNTTPGQLFVQQPTILVGCGGAIAVGGNVYQMPATSSVSSTYEKVCD